mmetsp:Transcript_24358/g.60418  ORF Transcript_24358/g.60418 Transcript_24358/m.60418 type:complete len:206 (+) Transcript_24358:628-1245(+)
MLRLALANQAFRRRSGAEVRMRQLRSIVPPSLLPPGDVGVRDVLWIVVLVLGPRSLLLLHHVLRPLRPRRAGCLMLLHRLERSGASTAANRHRLRLVEELFLRAKAIVMARRSACHVQLLADGSELFCGAARVDARDGLLGRAQPAHEARLLCPLDDLKSAARVVAANNHVHLRHRDRRSCERKVRPGGMRRRVACRLVVAVFSR